MKKCPFCAEEILDKAVKCKHCSEWLNKSDTLGQNTNRNVDKKSFNFLKRFVIWALILSVVLNIIFLGISDSAADDGRGIVFGGTVLSLFIAIIVTYIHKWIFERKNPQQSKGIEKPSHFGVFDWFILIGGITMLVLYVRVLIGLGEGLLLVGFGKIEDPTKFFGQLLGMISWVAIALLALITKLKKLKSTKTEKLKNLEK